MGMTTQKDCAGIEIITISREMEVTEIKTTINKDNNQHRTEDQITNIEYRLVVNVNNVARNLLPG